MRRSQLAASAALALALAGAGSASLAAEAPAPVRSVDQGAPAVDSDRGSVDEVAELVTAYDTVDGFAKAELDYDERTVSVLWKGQPPAGLTKLAEADPDGVDVTIAPAKYSDEEIREAGLALMKDEIAAGGARTITATYADQNSSGLVVEVDAGAPASARGTAAEDRYSKRVGHLPVTIRDSATRTIPATRQNDYAPYKGGAGILIDGGYCSTGFAITMTNGTGRLLTAAHCHADAGDIVRDAYNEGIGYISSVDAPTWDSALIDPTASPATTGSIYGGGAFNQPGNARYLLDVAGSASPVVGQDICTGGARSGEHGTPACDEIWVTATSVNIQCPGIANVCNTFRFTSKYSGVVATALGDSGGPAYIQRTDGRVGARGVVIAANADKDLTCPDGIVVPPPNTPGFSGCFREGYAVTVPRLLDRWNATLETN